MDERTTAVRCPCGHAFQAPATTGAREVACPACKKAFTPAKQDASTQTPHTPSGSAHSKTARRFAGVPPPPDLTVNIPGFRLERRLGAGGMGDVYLARQESLDRLVAVKLLPPDLAKDRSYVEHFLKEARSAAKVTHENIVGAFDCGEANGR